MATDFGSSQNLGNTACLLKTNPYEETEEAKEKPKGMRRETQGKEELTSYTATLSRMMLDKGGQSPRRKTLQKATNLLRLAESMSQVISLSKESNRALLTGIPLSISMRRKNERMTLRHPMGCSSQHNGQRQHEHAKRNVPMRSFLIHGQHNLQEKEQPGWNANRLRQDSRRSCERVSSTI